MRGGTLANAPYRPAQQAPSALFSYLTTSCPSSQRRRLQATVGCLSEVWVVSWGVEAGPRTAPRATGQKDPRETTYGVAARWSQVPGTRYQVQSLSWGSNTVRGTVHVAANRFGFRGGGDPAGRALPSSSKTGSDSIVPQGWAGDNHDFWGRRKRAGFNAGARCHLATRPAGLRTWPSE